MSSTAVCFEPHYAGRARGLRLQRATKRPQLRPLAPQLRRLRAPPVRRLPTRQLRPRLPLRPLRPRPWCSCATFNPLPDTAGTKNPRHNSN